MSISKNVQNVYRVHYLHSRVSKRQKLSRNQKLNTIKNGPYGQLYQRISILPAMDRISFKMCLHHRHGNQSM